MLAKKTKRVSPPIAKKAIKEIKFTPYSVVNYSEEYQVTGFHYAFMSADNQMCHHWVKCRDFLQDALRNQLTGRNDKIYSFDYKPGQDPVVDTKTTRMLVKRTPTPADSIAQRDFDEMIESALSLINHYEKVHKLIPYSKVIKAKAKSSPDYVYLFQGPGIWSQGAIMIAIYTFLIRLGYFKPVFKDEESLLKEYDRIINSKDSSNDSRYLKIVHENIHPALEHRAKHIFKPKGWKKGDKVLFHNSNMSQFHHHSGIVSLSQFSTPVKKLNDEFRKIFSTKK